MNPTAAAAAAAAPSLPGWAPVGDQLPQLLALRLRLLLLSFAARGGTSAARGESLFVALQFVYCLLGLRQLDCHRVIVVF